MRDSSSFHPHQSTSSLGLVSLPLLEREEDWEQHRAGIVASVRPSDPLEVALAERVAHLLWRLARHQRAERELLAIAQETAERQLADKRRWEGYTAEWQQPVIIRDRLEERRGTVELYHRFAILADDQPLEGFEASELIWEAARVAQVDLEIYPLPGVGQDDDLEELPGWTVGRVWECIRAIAQANPDDPHELLQISTRAAEQELRKVEREAQEMEAQLSRLRREALLLGQSDADSLRRQEAHLSRELQTALLELETRQGRCLQAGRLQIRVEAAHALLTSGATCFG